MHQLEIFSRFPELICTFSGKVEGNMSFSAGGSKSEVLENRKKFLEKLNVLPDDCVALSLVHRDDLAEVRRIDRGKGMGEKKAVIADGLLTMETGLYLFLLTADCLPVIFYEPDKKIIALLHLSVKNSRSNLIEKVIKRFDELGGRPENIIVGIGPAIHKESYIYEFVQNPEELNISAWDGFIKKLARGAIAIDLIGYNLDKLIKFGVPAGNIEASRFDTASSEEFFSHHREIKNGRKEGRFAAVVGMKD